MVMNLKKMAWIGVTAVAALAAGVRAHPPGATSAAQTSPPSPQPAPESQAEEFLAAVRGADPVACELILRSVGQGWGWGWGGRAPDAERAVLERVRWATGRRSDPASVPVLAAGLEDVDACVRRASARLLGATRHADAVAALLGALQSANATTRQLAAVGLGYADQPEAVDPLLGALSDGDASVRVAAAWALGRIEDRRAVTPLTRLLLDDADAGVRRAAAEALGDILG
jgi:hypothetical protein